MTEHVATDSVERLLPHVATRVLGVPLMITNDKLDVILSVLGGRVGLDAGPAVEMATDGAKKRSRTTLEGSIATIEISGTLAHKVSGLDALSGMTAYSDIHAEIAAAADNPKVSAILLMIDSPGGEVHGVFDLADAIHAARAKKPIAALAAETAASAAYLIASAAEQIFVAQSGLVGSIGVIGKHIDRSEANAQRGIKVTLLSSDDVKAFGHPDAPLTEDARAYLMARIGSFYGLFVDKVAKFRAGQLSPEKIRTMRSAVMHGPEAVTAGLADDVKTKDQALAWLENAAAERSKVSARKETTMTQSVTLTAAAIAAFTAEHPEMVAALQASASEAAVAGERARIADITALADDGQGALLATLIKDGADVATAAKKLTDDRRAAKTKAVSDLTGDRPAPVAAAPVDPVAAPAKISADLPIAERAALEWDADPKLRTEFAGDKDSYLAWRKRNPT